ncbi:MAG: hypothetical protein K6F08_00520 [bacterium]|nr:hypothetical protein [bacterium]
MSVRLWPETFVTMEVILKLAKKINKKPYITGKKDLYIDIIDCIKLQNDLNYSPHLHIFTSYPGSSKNWDKEDYEAYFKKVGCFSQIEDSTIYKINTQTLFKDLDNSSESAIKKCICNKLLIDGAYSGITIATLGLSSLPSTNEEYQK